MLDQALCAGSFLPSQILLLRGATRTGLCSLEPRLFLTYLLLEVTRPLSVPKSTSG